MSVQYRNETNETHVSIYFRCLGNSFVVAALCKVPKATAVNNHPTTVKKRLGVSEYLSKREAVLLNAYL